jgi:serine/threonine-protein kinase
MPFPEHTDALAGPADATISLRIAPGTPTAFDPACSPIPHFLGRYRVLDEIARGGMGIVLRVYDADLDRELAVKLLAPEIDPDSETGRRFVQEPRVMSQLYHPGIIPVFEANALPDGRPYFAMPFIRGKTLATLLAGRRHPKHDYLSWLGIYERLCDAIAHAHEMGIVHRDLKPANVMVGEFGEVVVMDWGVAASVTAANRGSIDSTAGFWVYGTPAYMAPEQARGIVLADPRGDVFGLGAVLCEILTGQPPYVGQDVATVSRMACDAAQGEMNCRLNACSADASLVALARNCLAPEPAERPSDASEVANAIREFLIFSGLRPSTLRC